MDARLRRLIRERAENRCEYCLIPQSAVKMPLQAEHIIALQHHGASIDANLALACDRCNLYKGTNLSAIDPQDGTVVGLFNPRKDSWRDHFSIQGEVISGITPAGRATAGLLQFNAENRLQVRQLLMLTGQW